MCTVMTFPVCVCLHRFISVLSVCVAACCVSEAWAAAPMLLMISCSRIPVIADLYSPLSASTDQPSAATGPARAFLIHSQHTHTNTNAHRRPLLTPTANLTRTASRSPTLLLPSVSIVLSLVFKGTACSPESQELFVQ